MFENSYFVLFPVYNQFEIWIWIKLLFCWFVIIIFDRSFFKLLLVFCCLIFVFSFIVVGTSCKYNSILLHTEFRLKINCEPVGNWYLITLKYNTDQQHTNNTFPTGSTIQYVNVCVFITLPRKWKMGFFMHWPVLHFPWVHERYSE